MWGLRAKGNSTLPPQYLFSREFIFAKTEKNSHSLRIEITRTKGHDFCYSGHLMRICINKWINDEIPALFLNISIIKSRTWQNSGTWLPLRPPSKWSCCWETELQNRHRFKLQEIKLCLCTSSFKALDSHTLFKSQRVFAVVIVLLCKIKCSVPHRLKKTWLALPQNVGSLFHDTLLNWKAAPQPEPTFPRAPSIQAGPCD